jgi:2-polyprenyl-3-methyl-5-hydroxy-6-metoxy-1,4-benzoquinol methylase
MARLRAMSASPHPPEPPAKSLVVDLLMGLVGKRGGLQTPHLHGGEDSAKVEYEYRRADSFWTALAGMVGPEALAAKDVLDAGCGWGGKDLQYAETTGLKSIVGFDLPGIYKPEVTEVEARKRGLTNCIFTTGYAESMPFEDAAFDVVIMEDVLEHVTDPARTMDECCRVLRPRGLLIARFPSLRMLGAHHFDRAIVWPGLHYLLPMRHWAAGFNHYLLHNRHGTRFDPFSEVVSTPYRKAVTRDLNGMDLAAFRRIVERLPLRVLALELVGYPKAGFTRHLGSKGSLVYSAYEVLRALPPLREPLGMSIGLVGEKAG